MTTKDVNIVAQCMAASWLALNIQKSHDLPAVFFYDISINAREKLLQLIFATLIQKIAPACNENAFILKVAKTWKWPSFERCSHLLGWGVRWTDKVGVLDEVGWVTFVMPEAVEVPLDLHSEYLIEIKLVTLDLASCKPEWIILNDDHFEFTSWPPCKINWQAQAKLYLHPTNQDIVAEPI